MAGKYWIKLYKEIIDDPKMGMLTDRLYRRTIEIFCLADDDGFLPTIKHMSWKLHLSTEELETDLADLASTGIVQSDGDRWLVTNYQKRQEPVSGAERTRQWRKRKQQDEYYGDKESDEDVTNRHGELELETESNGTAVPPANLDGWLEAVKKSKNRNATLMFMFRTLYPKATEEPGFGYLGRTANNVGGAGRLAALMWDCSSKKITGDVMRYIQGYAKRNKLDPVTEQKFVEWQ